MTKRPAKRQDKRQAKRHASTATTVRNRNRNRNLTAADKAARKRAALLQTDPTPKERYRFQEGNTNQNLWEAKLKAGGKYSAEDATELYTLKSSVSDGSIDAWAKLLLDRDCKTKTTTDKRSFIVPAAFGAYLTSENEDSRETGRSWVGQALADHYSIPGEYCTVPIPTLSCCFL